MDENGFLKEFEARLESVIIVYNKLIESDEEEIIINDNERPDPQRIYWDLLNEHNLKLHDIDDNLYSKICSISEELMKNKTKKHESLINNHFSLKDLK